MSSEYWPASDDRYAPIGDANPPLRAIWQQEDMEGDHGTRLAREFTMGGGSDTASELLLGGKLKDPDEESSIVIDKVLLITETPHLIGVSIRNECISGIALSRGEVVFTSGQLFSDEIDEKGLPIGLDTLMLKLDPENPVLNGIEMQSCSHLTEEGKVEKKLSYLRLSTPAGGGGGEDGILESTLVFGEIHPAGMKDENAKCAYSEVESVSDSNFIITGIGFRDNNFPLTLQVVDLGFDVDEDDIVDHMDTCVYYNTGVISGKNKLVQHGDPSRRNILRAIQMNSIVTEDEEVWDALRRCAISVSKNSNPCCGELLPNCIDLFEKALSGDLQTIHAIFRLDRFLSYLIQEKKSLKMVKDPSWNNHHTLIPLKQMWGVFANSVERMKRIQSTQPQLNAFNVAFLQGSDDYRWQAVYIFLTQGALLTLTLFHIWDHREEALRIPKSYLRLLVSVLGTLIVRYMGVQSRENFSEFAKIFPEYRGSFIYILDRLSNVTAGRLVCLSTFTLLFMTNDNLDIVLNATALLFVLELDELNVDNNPVWISGIYRAFFLKDIIEEFKRADRRYWNPEYLKRHGEEYKIHTDSCSYLFPKK